MMKVVSKMNEVNDFKINLNSKDGYEVVEKVLRILL